MSNKCTRRLKSVRSRRSAGDHRDLTFDWNSEAVSFSTSVTARSLRWIFSILLILTLEGWPKPAIAWISNHLVPPTSQQRPDSPTNKIAPPAKPAPLYRPSHATPKTPAARATRCAAGQ